ncbi:MULTISPECIES: GNAT family N-acetyltransferase [Terrabacteria group]|uniref:GNAT family N-acetyltransferase n=1 Tax=Bacillati TaxID=1783272 RepID=UPI001C6E1EAB|nr:MULTISPECIES: GNAT family N-acetyltransferase [Terrabacteria group]MBW9212063.1 N-acetyltransferase [Trueperella sp. zg.1013]
MKLEMRKDRAILLDDKKVVGYCSYVEEGDVWKIDHTVVEEAYQGQGLAKKVFLKVVEEARKQGKRIVPVCSYAIHQFEKHESLQDVLKG